MFITKDDLKCSARVPADAPDVGQMEAARRLLSGRNEILIRHGAINTQPGSRCGRTDDI